jgi:carbonic anhydrase
MNEILNRAVRFRRDIFPDQQALYRKLARDGQQPRALMISCADSRVVPELITQSGPGELFVCRNAGNIVPPFAQANGGVSSAIEYAVMALDVRDIIVCGHSDCGAMKALVHPEALESMPNVKAWLRHSHAAQCVVCETYPPGLDDREAARALTFENVVVQLNHLRTHPSVAAGIAAGRLTLHGWFFDLGTGDVCAYDGERRRFVRVADEGSLPVALAAVPHGPALEHLAVAAE